MRSVRAITGGVLERQVTDELGGLAPANQAWGAHRVVAVVLPGRSANSLRERSIGSLQVEPSGLPTTPWRGCRTEGLSHSAPYGSWTSPITADVLTTTGLTLSEVLADSQDLYWLEGRPTEGGRVVLVRLREGAVADVTPPPLNVRTRVHEYGGGAYDARDGVVVYSDFADGRLHAIENGQTWALAPTVKPSQLRFGDLHLDLPRRRVLCVREDHRSPHEVVNELVAVSLDGKPSQGQVLVTGPDFVAAPRLSPDGKQRAVLRRR